MMSSGHLQPERIVVGIDGSFGPHRAVRWSVDHARPGDEVILVHAWNVSPTMTEVGSVDADDDVAARRFVLQELARAKGLLRDDAITLSCEVVKGDPKSGLCRVPGDLLVVGTRGHGGLTGRLLGSVSAHLAHHCPVPLVIVPGP